MSATARGCLFFYSHTKGEHTCLSQFYPANFVDEAGVEYNCAEQFMMASKARCMGDSKTLERILQCGCDPAAIKELGRRVTPYVEERWASVRSAAVARGNFLKFSQNAKLRKLLLGTAGLTLVEAAGNDRVWGIGINVKDAAAGKKWNGLNLLGEALMKARQAIAAGEQVPAPPLPPDIDGGAPAAGAEAPDAAEAGAAQEGGAGGPGEGQKR